MVHNDVLRVIFQYMQTPTLKKLIHVSSQFNNIARKVQLSRYQYLYSKYKHPDMKKKYNKLCALNYIFRQEIFGFTIIPPVNLDFHGFFRAMTTTIIEATMQSYGIDPQLTRILHYYNMCQTPAIGNIFRICDLCQTHTHRGYAKCSKKGCHITVCSNHTNSFMYCEDRYCQTRYCPEHNTIKRWDYDTDGLRRCKESNHVRPKKEVPGAIKRFVMAGGLDDWDGMARNPVVYNHGLALSDDEDSGYEVDIPLGGMNNLLPPYPINGQIYIAQNEYDGYVPGGVHHHYPTLEPPSEEEQAWFRSLHNPIYNPTFGTGDGGREEADVVDDIVEGPLEYVVVDNPAYEHQPQHDPQPPNDQPDENF